MQNCALQIIEGRSKKNHLSFFPQLNSLTAARLWVLMLCLCRVQIALHSIGFIYICICIKNSQILVMMRLQVSNYLCISIVSSLCWRTVWRNGYRIRLRIWGLRVQIPSRSNSLFFFFPSECTSHHLYFIIFHLCYHVSAKTHSFL